MPAIPGVHPSGRLRRSNFAPGEIVERSRVSRKKTTVQWVSRKKTSVRWTLVPANAQATDGLGRYASEAGSAKRRGGSEESAVCGPNDAKTLRRKEFEQFSVGPLCVARESPAQCQDCKITQTAVIGSTVLPTVELVDTVVRFVVQRIGVTIALRIHVIIGGDFFAGFDGLIGGY